MSSLGYYGNPAAMRSEAASAELRAEQIAALARRLLAQADSIEFEGPAADAFRDAMGDRTRRAETAAAELQDVATTLRNAAANADEAIAREALERQREERRREAEAERESDW